MPVRLPYVPAGHAGRSARLAPARQQQRGLAAAGDDRRRSHLDAGRRHVESQERSEPGAFRVGEQGLGVDAIDIVHTLDGGKT